MMIGKRREKDQRSILSCFRHCSGAAIKNIGLGLALGLDIGAGMDAEKPSNDE